MSVIFIRKSTKRVEQTIILAWYTQNPRGSINTIKINTFWFLFTGPFSLEKDFVSRKSGMTRRSASLRQTRTAQISLDVPVPPPHISPPPAYTPAKKSNWEVIEHFNTSRGRSSVSSSLIAVCDVMIYDNLINDLNK